MCALSASLLSRDRVQEMKQCILEAFTQGELWAVPDVQWIWLQARWWPILELVLQLEGTQVLETWGM